MTDRREYDTDHLSVVPPTVQAHPDNIAIQIDLHFKNMEDVFAGYPQQLARYHSSNYKANQDYKDEFPENPLYRLMATTRSQFLAGTPQAWLRTLNPDPAKTVKAAAIKHSGNRLAREQKMGRVLEKLLVDWNFRRASVRYMVRPDPTADRGPLDGPAMRPITMRIPPPDLIYDPCAREWEETGIRGDRVRGSKSKIIAHAKRNPQEGWDIEALEGLAVGAGIEKMERWGDLGKQVSEGNRDDVVLYRIWFPDEMIDEDFTPEAGFHGVERVYAECERVKSGGRTHCGNLVEVKAAQSTFGPRTGPVGMFGQMYVPDQVEPLSISVASEHVVKSHGMRAKTLEIQMAEYARIIIEGTGTRNMAQLIKDARYGGVVKAKGYTGKEIKEFVKGGVDAATMAAYQFESDRLDQMLGLTAAQSGQTKAGVTATAEIQAAGGTGARMAGMLNSFVQIPQEMFFNMFWQIDGNENIYMKLPPEVEAETGVAVGAIRGGRSEGEAFEDYEMGIEVRSMKYRSDEEQMLVAERQFEIMTTLGPMMPQTPWVDWEAGLEELGEAIGTPNLARMFNYEMAEQVAGMLLMTQIPQGAGFQGSQPKPGPFNASDKSGAAGGQRTMDTTAQTRPFGQQAMAKTSASGANPSKGAASGASSGAKAGARAKASAR